MRDHENWATFRWVLLLIFIGIMFVFALDQIDTKLNQIINLLGHQK